MQSISLSEMKISLQAIAWNITYFVLNFSEYRILTPKSLLNLFSDSIKEKAERKKLCFLLYEGAP